MSNETKTTTVSLDESELPAPPDTQSVEWAIALFKRTMRKRKGPCWNSSDFDRVETALNLRWNEPAAMPRGLMRKFHVACGKLALCIGAKMEKAAWQSFGERLQRIAPDFECLIAVATTIGLMERLILQGNGAQWSHQESLAVADGARRVRAIALALPQGLVSKFQEISSKFEWFLRRGFREPYMAAVAGQLGIQIPSAAEVDEVEKALAFMKRITLDRRRASWCNEEVEHLRRVFERFGARADRGQACFLLPFENRIRLRSASYHLAFTVFSITAPGWDELRNTLRIAQAPAGLCYMINDEPLSHFEGAPLFA